ncbi:GNAT family N-acetyltransferase [Nocardiopsis halotolerans]|uniref:GNAT family N-acetyltransferase n=1 Tax=Nocardiopsis halotolerans TaxID=124252 RepID=UPI000346B4FC|nr:GNAT family N-acetyltransferase [Nocardiopsis halotolerans]
MTPLTRPATAGDLTAVLSLLGETNPDDPPMGPAEAARVWAEVARQRGRTLLVCEVGSRVVGTVDCLVMPQLAREGRPVMFVENLVVARAHRRTGVGRLLMRRAERLALDAGCYKLQLLAAPDPHVHAFYHSCGFSPCPDGFRKYVGAAR